MTREKAMEIKGLLGKGGKIDENGLISGCCVWTTTIENILKLGEMIFFNDTERKMQVGSWPEPEPELIEPEWKQKVRGIIMRHAGTIDEEGNVHGLLYTVDIEGIIKVGGHIMLHSSGEVSISNWRD